MVSGRRTHPWSETTGRPGIENPVSCVSRDREGSHPAVAPACLSRQADWTLIGPDVLPTPQFRGPPIFHPQISRSGQGAMAPACPCRAPRALRRDLNMRHRVCVFDLHKHRLAGHPRNFCVRVFRAALVAPWCRASSCSLSTDRQGIAPSWTNDQVALIEIWCKSRLPVRASRPGSFVELASAPRRRRQHESSA